MSTAPGQRAAPANPALAPVGDIDLLELGEPDRSALYEVVRAAEQRLGREVQVTARKPGWVQRGEGSFHATVTSRPMAPLPVTVTPAVAPKPGLTSRLTPRRPYSRLCDNLQ